MDGFVTYVCKVNERASERHRERESTEGNATIVSERAIKACCVFGFV